jgi:hypothetical protein
LKKKKNKIFLAVRENSYDSLYEVVRNYDINLLSRVVSGLEEEYRLEEAQYLLDKCLEIAKSKKKRKFWDASIEIILKRKKRLNRLQDKPVIKKVSWVILPLGFKSPEIEMRLETIFGANDKKINEANKRLNAIKQLSPNRVWMGADSFNDYLAYEFAGCSSVMLESLYYGNATFIIKENWKKLSKLTKSEVSKERGVTRIIHDCTHNLWVRKVKTALSF